MKPPFENYRECDIGDQEGHVCTCENEEITKRVLLALNGYYCGSEGALRAVPPETAQSAK